MCLCFGCSVVSTNCIDVDWMVCFVVIRNASIALEWWAHCACIVLHIEWLALCLKLTVLDVTTSFFHNLWQIS